MASLSLSGTGNADDIARIISHEMQNSALSCELVDMVTRSLDGMQVYVMVFEKYYMRASNRASLTVVVSGKNGNVYVDAIGSGGGQGVIFKFSWGAEKSFIGDVEDILRRHGFK